MLSANVCAGFFCSCYGEGGNWRLLGIWGGPWSLVHMEGAGSACLPLHVQKGVPTAGRARRAEVGGSIIFVTLGELTGLHKIL